MYTTSRTFLLPGRIPLADCNLFMNMGKFEGICAYELYKEMWIKSDGACDHVCFEMQPEVVIDGKVVSQALYRVAKPIDDVKFWRSLDVDLRMIELPSGLFGFHCYMKHRVEAVKCFEDYAIFQVKEDNCIPAIERVAMKTARKVNKLPASPPTNSKAPASLICTDCHEFPCECKRVIPESPLDLLCDEELEMTTSDIEFSDESSDYVPDSDDDGFIDDEDMPDSQADE